MHKIFFVCLLAGYCFLSCVNALQAADLTPGQLVEEARSQVASVPVPDVKKMIDAEENIVLLDVRDREEFSKGHLPGAVNISRGLLEFLVEDRIPDKNTKIIVY